jgi:acetolactate synthase-1/2/3 large subunit
MAYIHGGVAVARAMAAAGVDHLFTLCGGHIQNIYDGCLDLGIRVVDVRHEQTAAHAADGWARVTGRPGVAAVTAGPGVTDAVTGVATAWRAQSPMVLIGGAGPLMYKDMGSLQDMDHVELMRPVTKWAATVPETRRLAEYMQRAFQVAAGGVPGPVFLEMPFDVLAANVDVFDKPTQLVDWVNPDVFDAIQWTSDRPVYLSTRIWDHQVVITAEQVRIYTSTDRMDGDSTVPVLGRITPCGR